ncbi:hypothetical protein F443_00006, partial [Phytophthora nicotianae P1569]
MEAEETDRDPRHFYTFWRKEEASRLDRFYVKGEPLQLMQWVEVKEPAYNSDHQE